MKQDWSRIEQAGETLMLLHNRVANLETVILPENWRLMTGENEAQANE